ncbi:MAG: site-specific DNA-methyltransferase, partial [Alphaproteobacteria bacterium]|nr:site-specific DNA-methyltransferase [Alphaproteobacteria bacterium]
AAHVWFSETGTPWQGSGKSPFLGVHKDRAYALLYNGILGDRSVNGGNVLTKSVLAFVREKVAKKAANFSGQMTIYGERSALSPATLAKEGITFKQTPYDVKVRK